MTKDIVVIDYGSGNTRSMTNALQRARRDDQRVLLTANPNAIRQADRVVLPGVGAFAECRRKLDASGVLPALSEAVAAKKPFLGVCVGMQILADEGREFETSPGLGWIPGVTRRLTFSQDYEGRRRLPHIEWSPTFANGCALFDGLRDGELFYYVHSFILDCHHISDRVATAVYGETFAAAVLHENIFACQFHPEKSADAGLHLLENFCRWQP